MTLGQNQVSTTVILLFFVFFCSFHRTIRLGTIWLRVALLDFELCTKLINDLVIEIPNVVNYGGRGDLILGDDIALGEICHEFGGDERECDGLDPFCEVVNHHKN